MNRIVDWFRKQKILAKCIQCSGMFDGDFIVYKRHRYYVNCQNGVVFRVE